MARNRSRLDPMYPAATDRTLRDTYFDSLCVHMPVLQNALPGVSPQVHSVGTYSRSRIMARAMKGCGIVSVATAKGEIGTHYLNASGSRSWCSDSTRSRHNETASRRRLPYQAAAVRGARILEACRSCHGQTTCDPSGRCTANHSAGSVDRSRVNCPSNGSGTHCAGRTACDVTGEVGATYCITHAAEVGSTEVLAGVEVGRT